MVAAERSSAAMATAASKFLGALTPEQRQQATFAFANSDERLHWHFIPTGDVSRARACSITRHERGAARSWRTIC